MSHVRCTYAAWLVVQSAAFRFHVHKCLNNLAHSRRHVLFINYAVLYSRNLGTKGTSWSGEGEGKRQMMITKRIEGLADGRMLCLPLSFFSSCATILAVFAFLVLLIRRTFCAN